MIVVIDYGMGNLRSVSKALEHLGARVKISDAPEDILTAEKIVLPGVGAFGDAMRELRLRRLDTAILQAVEDRKPLLGICLGLQLLFTSSAESPGVTGLDIFPGTVERFRSKGIKIPHMGWNSATLIQKSHPLLKGVPSEGYFYFVHTYYAVPKDPKIAAARTTYGTEEFPAMLGTESVFATQFHPEKSQDVGLNILKNFIQW